MKLGTLARIALEFFPNAQGLAIGIGPDPWVRVLLRGTSWEVHVPRQIADSDFEAEVIAQFERLMAHIGDTNVN
jgi:hypothetical protein